MSAHTLKLEWSPQLDEWVKYLWRPNFANSSSQNQTTNFSLFDSQVVSFHSPAFTPKTLISRRQQSFLSLIRKILKLAYYQIYCAIPFIFTATYYTDRKTAVLCNCKKAPLLDIAHWLHDDVLLSNSAFLIFAVLVVCFSHSHPYKMF